MLDSTFNEMDQYICAGTHIKLLTLQNVYNRVHFSTFYCMCKVYVVFMSNALRISQYHGILYY